MGVFLFYFCSGLFAQLGQEPFIRMYPQHGPVTSGPKRERRFFCPELAFPSRFVQSRDERRDAGHALPNMRMQDGVQCIESITLTKKCGSIGMQIHTFRARRIDSEKSSGAG